MTTSLKPIRYNFYDHNITGWNQLEFGARYGINLKQADDIASRESSRVVEIFEGTLNDTIFLEFDDFFIQIGYEYASQYHNDLFVEKLPKNKAWDLMDQYSMLEESY